MKCVSRYVLTALALTLSALGASAIMYNDSTGEEFSGNGILDIASVEVTNNATHITFVINLSGDPQSFDWGKYMVAIDSKTGGDASGNGWGRPISMTSGMDYWIGSWVDSGGGAELYSWDGAAWNKDHATYSSPSDVEIPITSSGSVAIRTTLSSLGMTAGDSFVFDVFTSGGGGGDSANDSLSDDIQSISDWPGPYASVSTLVYAVAPTSSGVDVRAFQTAEGVVVEFVAYDVEADGAIMLALMDDDGGVLWSESVDVTAGPQSFARFAVPGLELGGSYHFKVRDEVGKWWDAPGVTVQPFAAEMVGASLESITLSFDSLPEHHYDIQWTPELGTPWQKVGEVTADSAKTEVVVPHPDPENAAGFFRFQLK